MVGCATRSDLVDKVPLGATHGSHVPRVRRLHQQVQQVVQVVDGAVAQGKAVVPGILVHLGHGPEDELVGTGDGCGLVGH